MTIVKVKEGALKGEILKTSNGFQYLSYKGIPYAKPPVGHLRFRDPQKVNKWDGVKNATVECGICPQLDKHNRCIVGDEDCLFLNVYTPCVEESSSHKIPVMVWIHGGGFYKGSGNYESCGGDYLIEKNVVYVSVNYRFGIFGFLCMHSKDVPGNAGLKDQILALQWVHENIAVFGGDPNNVTIFGESAGAASISFLSLSPATNGLFQKVIIQSGTSLCPWAIQQNPMEYVMKIAEKFAINAENKNEVLKYLQSMPVNELLSLTSDILNDDDAKRYLPIAFLPVIEHNFPGVVSVINKHPEEVYISGNFTPLPSIVGYSSKEGVFMMEKIGCSFDKVHNLIPSLEYFLPPNGDKLKVKQSVETLNEFYFNSKPIDITQVNNVIDILSDYLFRHPINHNVNLLTRYSSAPVFYFQFSYQGNHSRDKKIFRELNLEGASHSEECGYIFKKQYLEDEEPSPGDITTRQRMTDMWTNFAKTGNPTPEINESIPVIWKSATKDELHYLEIGENLKMSIEPNAAALQLWSNVHEDLNAERVN